MADFKSLVRSSRAIFSSQVITTIINILFLAYFARSFDKYEMAIFALIQPFSAWIGVLGGFGLNTLALKEIPSLMSRGESTQAGALTFFCFTLKSTLIFLLGLLATIAAEDMASVFDFKEQHIVFFIIMIWVGAFSAVFQTVMNLLDAHQAFVLRSRLNICFVVFQRFLGVLGFLFMGSVGFFWLYLVATVLLVFSSLYYLRTHLVLSFLNPMDIFTKAKHLFVADIMYCVLWQLDKPLIGFLAGPESLAGYHIAQRLFQNFFRFTTAIISPLGVRFGNVLTQGEEKIKSYYRFSTTTVLLIVFPLSVILFNLSEEFLLLLGGEKYLSEDLLAKFFALTLLSASGWAIFREASLRILEPKTFSRIYLVLGLSYSALLYCCVSLFGSLGAAFAMLGTFSFGVFLFHYYNKKEHPYIVLSNKPVAWAIVIGCLISVANYVMAFGGQYVHFVIVVTVTLASFFPFLYFSVWKNRSIL